MKCKIIYKRDPNTLKITDEIQAVKAPNGKRSLLYDAIRNQINNDTKALTQYFKVYTDEFKEDFGDWEMTTIDRDESINDIKNSYKLVIENNDKIEDLNIDIEDAIQFDKNNINSVTQKSKDIIEQVNKIRWQVRRVSDGLLREEWEQWSQSAYDEVKSELSTDFLSTIDEGPMKGSISPGSASNLLIFRYLYPKNKGITTDQELFVGAFIQQILDWNVDGNSSLLNKLNKENEALTDSLNDNLKSIIINPEELNNISSLITSSDESNQSLGLEILNNYVNDKLDQNGEPKYDEVKDLFIDEEVDEGITVKEGVDDVFKDNKELSKIGTQEEYSQYLDSIFPDSKVKDIVYHGTDKEFDKFELQIIPKTAWTKELPGFHFTNNKAVAKSYFNTKERVSNLIPLYLHLNKFAADGKLLTEQEFDDIKADNDLHTEIMQQVHYYGGMGIDNVKTYNEYKRLFTEFSKDEGFDGMTSISDIFDLQQDEYEAEREAEHFGRPFTSTFKNPLDKYKKSEPKVLKSVILNIENPLLVNDISGQRYVQNVENIKSKIESTNDGIIAKDVLDALEDKEGTYHGDTIVAFDNEQIHILGSKKDIQGFKDYKSNIDQDISPKIISPSDKIIYGHPGIGKTTALKANKDQFIDWDVEFNKKRDKWIENKSKSKKGTPSYKKARTKYLVNYKDNPDYMTFVTKEWGRAKAKAKKEGKQLFASPHILLDLFPNDFDKVINMNDELFIKRDIDRGGIEQSARLWKEGINKTLSKISPSKIVTTDKYLSEILASDEVSKVEDTDQYSLTSSSIKHQGQPTTVSKTDTVKIDTDPFKSQLNDDGYTQEQIKILDTYNAATSSLTGNTIKVKVSELPANLRKIFELKGEEYAEVYETIDHETGKKGYINYRVSNLQDLKKVKGQTQKVATAQEQNPKSVISRQRGTEMHSIQEKFLSHFALSDNDTFNIDTLRKSDANIWAPEALAEFKKTAEYRKIWEESIDIFLTKSKSNREGKTWSTHNASLQVDKLAMSMLHLYHQIQMTQQAINLETGKNNKPIFILEKPFLDLGNDVAGTMDIFVIFSDGSASIYDHKFTDLQAERKYFKNPSTEKKAEIDRIRKAQGLPVNPETNWYFQLPNNLKLFKKEESWNAQIGRYAQMAKQLYGVTHIRQARILPVATTYTRVDSKREDKNGDTIMHVGPGSQVEVLLTGINDDLGVSQIALNIERTGDVNLDRFIDMLIKNKETLKREMKSKNAYGDPKYVNRIKGLDESIQALLKSRDITHISEAIDALAKQIENDLDPNAEDPITFEQIILHLGDINMFNTFIELSGNEIDKLEDKANKEAEEAKERGEEPKENPYVTFKNRLSAANFALTNQARRMHDKMTLMVEEINEKGGYMNEGLFKSFTKQKDMSGVGVQFTHLRESNHPIISLFSQLLDNIETNVMLERSKLEQKLKKINKELTEWGSSKGLTGPAIYNDIIDDEFGNLIRKFTNFKKDLFEDYSDPKNHKKNIVWFKENFERSASAEKIFQNKYKQIQEYWKRETKGDKNEYKKEIQNWLNQNDITHAQGDNKAWYNPFVQHWLTPKKPDDYYTDEYKNLLKAENKPLLDFYNIYIEQMNMLAQKADFRIYENAIPNIRKDMIDTMVQDGMFLGGKQQIENIRNWWSKTDTDDGMQTILTEDGLERSVPIFYQNNVGKDNKSFDLAKSLMLFSDFVHKYDGIKNIEHASLAMRELVSKTAGIKSTITGAILRSESGEMLVKDGASASNDKTLSAFDTWIDYYIYGERKKGNVKLNKAVDAVTAISSRKGVALNLISAMGGHVNAEAQLQMIAKKTTYFTTDTLSKARRQVKLGIPALRKSKEANEMLHSKVVFANLFFEPSQEDMSHEKANSMSLSKLRNNSLMGKKDYAYMLQRYSDDIIDNTTMTAMMMDYGIDPITGKTYPLSRLKKVYGENESEFKPGVRYKDIEFKSLWDMTMMKDGDVDLGTGKTVSIKLAEDGTPQMINQFTEKAIDSKTFTDFRRKTKQMIARTKGNMSADDIAGYKTHWIGRLVMQFRGWIPATLTERFKGLQYNLTMEQMEVGRFVAVRNMVGKNLKRVTGQFVKELLPFMRGNFGDGKVMSDVLDEQSPLELKYKQFIADNPHLKPDPENPTLDQVTYEDFFNSHVGEMRALAKEVQIYLALAVALGLLTLASGDDELKANPLLRGPSALLERAMLEIGFFIPVAGIPEQMTLFTRAPAASISLFQAAGYTAKNTFTEAYDLFTGAGSGKTSVPTLGDKPWTLDYSKRNDTSAPFKHTIGWIPPLKFIDNIIGFTNTTKREDTWYEYFQNRNNADIMR